MGIATRADLLKCRPRSEDVQIPSGITVRVRGLSLAGRNRYQSALTTVDSKGNVQMRADADYTRAAVDVLMECVIDESGAPILESAADVEQLSPADADAIFEKARELSGLTNTAVEAAAKNS